MTQQELTKLNIGENLDALMNLDPRGYGVCRILYQGARAHVGKPLAMSAAQKLYDTVKEDNIVFILTGFVLLPFKKAEMDGIVSSVLLARSLVKGLGAKPVIVCPKDNLEAVEALSKVVGLHLYDNFNDLRNHPISMAVVPFTKNADEARIQAKALLDDANPTAVISIEAPGENKSGVYHNAIGKDVTELEAKLDFLFDEAQNRGILDIAIGDLGNEIGMGTIGEHITRFVPYTGDDGCQCGCKVGSLARTKTNNIITATVSDWGGYAINAALAFLCNDIDVMHDAEMEEDAIHTAAKAGMIDMYGWMIPAIDGIDKNIHMAIVSLMRDTVEHALRLKDKTKNWFDEVGQLGFYKEGFYE